MKMNNKKMGVYLFLCIGVIASAVLGIWKIQQNRNQYRHDPQQSESGIFQKVFPLIFWYQIHPDHKYTCTDRDRIIDADKSDHGKADPVNESISNRMPGICWGLWSRWKSRYHHLINAYQWDNVWYILYNII